MALGRFALYARSGTAIPLATPVQRTAEWGARRRPAGGDEDVRMNWWRLTALLLLAACSSDPPLRTVSDFDAERYLGTWHEIAAIPAWFQRQCARDTEAVYTAVADPGEIGVANSCKRGDGLLDTALGRARFTAPPKEGRLEVTFLELGGHWVWPISGAYQVIALDPDYRWSLVGHPSRGYAWILAREPKLDDNTLLSLRVLLREGGYDPCRLVLTADGDPRRGRNLCELP